MSAVKYQSLDTLHKEAAYLRRRVTYLVDMQNRYGPDFWHYKINACRIKLRHIEQEIARRIP